VSLRKIARWWKLFCARAADRPQGRQRPDRRDASWLRLRNAGVDLSNVGLEHAALLPRDPDASARQIRADIERLTGVAPGVIISDSFGRPGASAPSMCGRRGRARADQDERGTSDSYGYELRAAVAAVSDELAGRRRARDGKEGSSSGGLNSRYEGKGEDGSVKELLRGEAEDLFR
jgi:coenzyme F420-0:L-glutamate ligase/coenzyme F420-1:gamma-L-glutamate ligase